MNKQPKLHEIFCEILGSRNAYFQPPSNTKMSYPAIVYSIKKIKNDFADDQVYMQKDCYEVTVIDKDPDSKIMRAISILPMCSFDRSYKADNLNHYVFTFYY